MPIITTPLRKVVKVALAKKYIDSLGLKMPSVPQLPNFEMPPMPDLEASKKQLYETAQKAADKVEDNDLYTDEYKAALKKYNQCIENAKKKYDADMLAIDNDLALAKQVDENGKRKSNADVLALKEKKKEVLQTYKDSVELGKIDSQIDYVVKFKKVKKEDKAKVNEDAKKTKEQKQAAFKEAMMKASEIAILNQYSEYILKEYNKTKKLVNDIVKTYKETVALIQNSYSEIKDYFTNGGGGEQFVDDECDKIDRIWDNFKDSFVELGVDMETMVAKIPNPEVIVAGAATGVPNPGEKVLVFMENFKKVMSDITKIANYIKEIIAIASGIGLDIMEMVSMFKKFKEEFEKLQGDADSSFKKAVKSIRKRKTWYCKYEDAEDGETKKCGYMYADISVDYDNYDITINGYKCYCRKNNAWVNGEKKKWTNGYEKNGGTFTDSSGKHYYYIKDSDLVADDDYDEEDAMPDYDIDSGTEYNDNVTKLKLSDGRTITIDYLAQVGDVVKLDDGTIITIE